jgi:apolipoprotein D and lipocalin family protein
METKRYIGNLTKLILVVILFSVLNASTCRSTQSEDMDLTTVKQLDLERYMGTWYEIARFDHSFERGLTHVTATYELRPDGKIKVINAGRKNGKLKTADGKAKQPSPSEPGKLKVAFFLFFYADYYVLELDENYQWALIGSSSDKYLWILSRNQTMKKDTLEHILMKADERGYDTSKLIWVEHD